MSEAGRFSEMSSRKRPRDLGCGEGSEDNSTRDFPAGASGDEIALQQPAAKRPRRTGFVLGSSVGALVDKVVRATASLLGRGRSDDGNESEENSSGPTDLPIPMDSSVSSETSEAAIPVQGPREEVLNPNCGGKPEANNEEPGASAKLPSSEEPGNGEGFVGQVTDEISDVNEQVLNPNENVNHEDATQSSSLGGPVEDEAGEVQMAHPAEEVPEDSEQVLIPNQNENLEDAQASSPEGPVENEVGEAVQEMVNAPEEVPEAPEQVLNPNQNEDLDDSQSSSPEIPVKNDAEAAVQEMTDSSEGGPDSNHYRGEPQDAVEPLSPEESGGERPQDSLDDVPAEGSAAQAVGAVPTPSTPPTTMMEVIDWERVEGAQAGLPRLPDADALRHALGFLRATELAHFCRSSTSARDVVSNHAALEMVNRFPTLRIGVREPPHHLSSPRRLAFGCPTANPAPTAGAPSATMTANNFPMGVVGHPYQHPAHQQSTHLMAQLQLQHLQNQQQALIPHSDLWDKEVVVGNVGSPTGSPVAPRGSRSSLRSAGSFHRGFLGDGAYGGGGRVMSWRRKSRGSGLARYDGQNVERALPSLHYLELCGDLLLSQQKTLPRLDLFRSLQSRPVLGSSQFLTAHMRAVLVDWMVEVAFQFKLSTIALHAAVSALDVCLSKVAVPRCRLQLLGVVCTMIQSQAGGGTQVMTTSDAIHICDSQYNPSQVHSTYNIVVSNTQEATSRTVPATAAEILNRLLCCMGEVSGLTRPLCSSWEKQVVPVKEEYLLANLLIDLALLDQYMFRFRPGTLATAALFFARVTASYYSKEGIMVTPFAIVEKKNREVLRLYSDGDCSPFIPLDADLEKRPFGAPGLWEFLSGQPKEAAAVRKCSERLWLVHQDFLKHISGKASPNPVLFRYQHMFKGIKDKFFPTGSIRLQAYQRLGQVPKPLLEGMLDKHLPSTVTPHGPVVFRGNTGGASASAGLRW